MLQTVNNKIQRGFGASARQYDLFSGLHRGIADQLLAQIIKESAPASVLDVGCGTGYLTIRLREHFSQSKVTGLDFAQDMLDVARSKHDGVEWVWGDWNNLPFPEKCFDAAISNLAYQWAGDLTRAFSEARRVLSARGVLACTLFGRDTCHELFQSLDEVRAGTFKFSRLPDERQVREALNGSGFKDLEVSVEDLKVEFKDMHGLMVWLKSIGANHLSREGHIGPDTIARAASVYREKFAYRQGVGVTFEVIRVYAKK